MADRIVIVGSRRAGTRVPPSEIVQMAGRCARRPGERGHVTIIAELDDIPEIRSAFQEGSGMVVESTMSNPEVAAFHLVAEIAYGRISTRDSATKWLDRSLAALQARSGAPGDALDVLTACGAVVEAHGFLEATHIGRVAAGMYFHPHEVRSWQENWPQVFERDLESYDAAVAWAVSNTNMKERFRVPPEASAEFSSEVDAVGLPYSSSCGLGSVWMSALGGEPQKCMRASVSCLRADVGRYVSAFKGLDNANKWGMSAFFERLGVRVAKGIPSELEGLCSISGVTKGMISELAEMGLISADEINGNWDIIRGTGSDLLIRKLMEAGFG